jgi:tRNA(fMet)-specific endonuclease VapC
MGVTVDTSVLIDILRDDPTALAQVDRLEGSGLEPYLSSVAVLEVLSGVESTRSKAERARIELILRQIPIEPFDLDSARKAGELRAELLRTGKSPGAPDVMIAGYAIAAGHTFLTRDQKLGEAVRALGLSTVVY